MKFYTGFQAIPPQAKLGVDVGSGMAIVASIAGYLPPIAALLSIIWVSLQIWSWFESRRKRKE